MIAVKHCDLIILFLFLGKTIEDSTDYYSSYFPDKIVDGIAANTTSRDSYCSNKVLHMVLAENQTN